MLPERLGAQVWQADRLLRGTIPAHPSQFAALDAQLPGGGWPLGMLTELIARDPGIGELRLLIPLLRRLTLERRIVILLAPPLLPYAPALAAFGVDLDYLIVIRAAHAADRLWAVEQTLRSTSFGALLAWLPQDRTRPEHLRRMQVAAQTCRGPVFLFRQLPAQFESSPAPLRLLLLPRPEQRLSVQLLKRRGPLLLDPIELELPQPALSLPLRRRATDRQTGIAATEVMAASPAGLLDPRAGSVAGAGPADPLAADAVDSLADPPTRAPAPTRVGEHGMMQRIHTPVTLPH